MTTLLWILALLLVAAGVIGAWVAAQHWQVRWAAIAAGIAVLIVFSFIGGGFASFGRGFSAGQQAAPFEQLLQEEIRLADQRSVGLMIAQFLVAALGMCLAGYVAARLAGRSPLTHATFLGSAYVGYACISLVVLALFVELGWTQFLESGVRIVLAIPLAAVGALLYRPQPYPATAAPGK